MMFCRGKPRNEREQACSFLLIYKLLVQDGRIQGFDSNYTYLKLDDITYVQYLARPQVGRKGNDTVIRVPLEDNYSESFPRQLYEVTVPDSDFDRDASLINTQY